MSFLWKERVWVSTIIVMTGCWNSPVDIVVLKERIIWQPFSWRPQYTCDVHVTYSSNPCKYKALIHQNQYASLLQLWREPHYFKGTTDGSVSVGVIWRQNPKECYILVENLVVRRDCVRHSLHTSLCSSIGRTFNSQPEPVGHHPKCKWKLWF